MILRSLTPFAHPVPFGVNFHRDCPVSGVMSRFRPTHLPNPGGTNGCNLWVLIVTLVILPSPGRVAFPLKPR